MFEIQLLTSGTPQITLFGRIKGLPEIERVLQLPYPPGSGREGEMLRMDKVMWFGAGPFMIVLLAVVFSGPLIAATGASTTLVTATVVVVSLIALSAYFVNLRRLIGRRLVWRP